MPVSIAYIEPEDGIFINLRKDGHRLPASSVALPSTPASGGKPSIPAISFQPKGYTESHRTLRGATVEVTQKKVQASCELFVKVQKLSNGPQ